MAFSHISHQYFKRTFFKKMVGKKIIDPPQTTGIPLTYFLGGLGFVKGLISTKIINKNTIFYYVKITKPPRTTPDF